MTTVGVSELRSWLSRCLRRTKEGEAIVVTERGKPIAIIQPVQSVAPVMRLQVELRPHF